MIIIPQDISALQCVISNACLLKLLVFNSKWCFLERHLRFSLAFVNTLVLVFSLLCGTKRPANYRWWDQANVTKQKKLRRH